VIYRYELEALGYISVAERLGISSTNFTQCVPMLCCRRVTSPPLPGVTSSALLGCTAATTKHTVLLVLEIVINIAVLTHETTCCHVYNILLPPAGVRSVVMSVSVCLYVCLSVCLLAHLNSSSIVAEMGDRLAQ